MKISILTLTLMLFALPSFALEENFAELVQKFDKYGSDIKEAAKEKQILDSREVAIDRFMKTYGLPIKDVEWKLKDYQGDGFYAPAERYWHTDIPDNEGRTCNVYIRSYDTYMPWCKAIFFCEAVVPFGEFRRESVLNRSGRLVAVAANCKAPNDQYASTSLGVSYSDVVAPIEKQSFETIQEFLNSK